MKSRAEQYRQLARDFHLMARSVPLGEHRSVLLKTAEEWERLADQQQLLSASGDGGPVSDSVPY